MLCDVRMPKLDGYQVLAGLKEDAKLSDVPVIFITGSCGTGGLAQGLESGAQDYLQKRSSQGSSWAGSLPLSGSRRSKTS